MSTARIEVIKWTAGVALSLAVGAGAGYWWAQQAKESAEAPSAATSRSSGGEKRRILYWHDPMVPDQKFDKPGKSPFMNMPLVPVYADEGEGIDVRINPSVVQNLGIRLGKAEESVLTPSLSAVGNVAFDESRLEVVQARSEGYVTKLYVKAALEQVRAGQPLAQVLSPQWRAAQEEYLALLDATSARGQSLRAAARQRLTTLGIPGEAIAALEKDRTVRTATTLRAPIEGVLTELAVREGATFMSGAPLFRINGIDAVWVNAQVPEAQVALLAKGSTMVAHANAWPGESFAGRVLAVLPQVDPQTRTLPVRVALDNRARKLAPGMFVSLEFTAPPGAAQLTVPSEAVIMTGERSVVIVAREVGGFDVAEVKAGAEVNGKTAILSGLSAGQTIVLSGQFLIDSEASLRSTVSRLSSEAVPAPQAQAVAHLADGRLTAIDARGITISHGAVPSLKWPAMTMTFKEPQGGLPADLKVGDRVSFSFIESSPGTYRIERLARLDEEQQPDALASPHDATEPHP
jgi:membrane fusion protein, copper/silver efflux system